MAKKEIIFKIDMETAEVEMEAIGFTGGDCERFSKPYEEALGKVIKRDFKTVRWQAEALKGQNHQQTGNGSAGERGRAEGGWKGGSKWA